MQTIYLDPNMVPAALLGGYSGKKFKAVVTTSVTINGQDGLWSGGSRDTFRAIKLETGETVPVSDNMSAPWDNTRKDRTIELKPGIAVIEHSIFCGKDMGLTFYVHPENAAKLLPAPTAELTAFEQIVLNATCSYKSSYNGMDRYEMARRDCRNGTPYPSRDEWNIAKQTLINLGLLNKAGAVTPKGRNASTSR